MGAYSYLHLVFFFLFEKIYIVSANVKRDVNGKRID